jgi:glycosyltransferase involved in cell wall biosynthesis
VTDDQVFAVVVMDHPAQQFARGLELLAAEPGVALQVLYWSAPGRVTDPGFGREVCWDVDLLHGYDSVLPPPGRASARLLWLVRHLRTARPDVVLCYGWATPIARTAIAYCVLTGTRLLMYGDTTWQHSSRGRRRAIRSSALRLLMRACTGAISTGTFNREFYIQHGMNPRRIWPGVCPADTEQFGWARAERPNHRPGEGPVRIGFAGKLIRRKGADVLLEAAALLAAQPPWSLTIVGDGPLMVALQAQALELGLADRVVFAGFANTSQMPELLAGFDIVVVPSRLDMRALVTIEAMSAGAAIVVSDATAVWGAGDLVQDGVTGLVHASDDPVDLARQLGRLVSEPRLLGELRRNGSRCALGYGPGAFAATVAAAARQCAASSGVRRPSMLRRGSARPLVRGGRPPRSPPPARHREGRSRRPAPRQSGCRAAR